MFRAETELSKAVARQTYPLDGGNAALAPALRVQFEIPDGVIVPTNPEVGEEGGQRREVDACMVKGVVCKRRYAYRM